MFKVSIQRQGIKNPEVIIKTTQTCVTLYREDFTNESWSELMKSFHIEDNSDIEYIEISNY